MDSKAIPDWLRWAREIQAIGQTGYHFSNNDFDRIRYQRLVELASEILAEYSQVPPKIYQELFSRETGYATPKVDVRAVVFQDDRILLVREKADGLWSLPGGYADINEAPSNMVEREVREESGFVVHARKITGVYEANHDRAPVQVYHAYKIIFLCDLLSGEAQTSEETLDVDFFPLDALPDLSPYRTNPRYIQEAYAHYRDGGRPAAFD
ncbi:MAG TPA: NUDIX hydrolase [Anaerolineaceae bacterium]|nr:NUDIX hydrolase [Anaerolineaceae bacterium]